MKKILWLTWKDLKNPLAGGAEVVNEQLAKRLVKKGYEVTFVVGGFSDAPAQEIIDGYTVIRVGSRWTVYKEAARYYKANLVGWADLVIDEINTIPFFAKYYVKEPNILFIHQLCREIWFYQMFFPLNLVGWLIEPLYLRLLCDRKVITISDSTKQDLLRHGFQADKITIISEGIELKPVSDLGKIDKYDTPTMLSLGAIREMKQTHLQIKAFEAAKQYIPNLSLKIAGDNSGTYAQKVMNQASASPHAKDIEILGRVTTEKKMELMQRSHLIAVTSVKEGWGLIVTEANSQGTPAVVYNVDGLRDSVKDGETGLIAKSNTPDSLALSIKELLGDQAKYDAIRRSGWEWSKTITFDRSTEEFESAL